MNPDSPDALRHQEGRGRRLWLSVYILMFCGSAWAVWGLGGSLVSVGFPPQVAYPLSLTVFVACALLGYPPVRRWRVHAVVLLAWAYASSLVGWLLGLLRLPAWCAYPVAAVGIAAPVLVLFIESRRWRRRCLFWLRGLGASE